MQAGELHEIVAFHVGNVAVSSTVVTTWGVIVTLALVCRLATLRLSDAPGRAQTALEAAVGAMENAVNDVVPEHGAAVFPFIATLWIYLVVANLVGLIPGLQSPTGDLSATAALAVIVFLSVHWFGIRRLGLLPYLRHYVTPSPLLLPFHLVSEVTRTVALAIRLFGNIMSLEMAAVLVLLVAGFLVPVPLLLLHVIEALVQAYIFGVLALLYIAGGLETQQQTAVHAGGNATAPGPRPSPTRPEEPS